LGVALGAPRFEPGAVERIRGQLLADVSRRNEDSDFIAAKTWYAKAFPEHPYGRSSRGEPETIRAITVADLQTFAAARFTRGEVMIGAVGDIEPAALGALIDRAFAALPPPAAAAAVTDVTVRTPGSLTVIRRKSPQSRVFLGLPGVTRSDPDYYAAYVVNYVLGGGGFTSRLYQEVREKRGLAYSVYSYLTTFRHAGLVMGGFATVNDRVAEALDLYKREIARLAREGISEPELADAKTYLTGSFPLRLDSNAKIAGALLGMQIDGLGIDFLDKRNDHINAVTIADVRRVASRILKLDDLTVVVVGDPQGLVP
jgi:zinc protease